MTRPSGFGISALKFSTTPGRSGRASKSVTTPSVGDAAWNESTTPGRSGRAFRFSTTPDLSDTTVSFSTTPEDQVEL